MLTEGCYNKEFVHFFVSKAALDMNTFKIIFDNMLSEEQLLKIEWLDLFIIIRLYF